MDSKGAIHYVGPYERNVGNGLTTTEVVTKYYYATFGQMRRLIAVRKAGVLYWIGTDHLGSTIRTANASFTPVDQMRYFAYGGSRATGADLQTDHKFTAQIEDQSIGLYWYNSRAYDPAIGRFVVPVSIVPGVMNPQALNRYAYTLTIRSDIPIRAGTMLMIRISSSAPCPLRRLAQSGRPLRRRRPVRGTN